MLTKIAKRFAASLGEARSPSPQQIDETRKDWTDSARDNLEAFRNSALVQSIGEHSVCIDCGANIGDVTEVFAARGAQVYAFEPHPLAYRALSERFADNPKVCCQRKGVCDRNGTMRLYMYQYSKEDPLFWSQGASVCRSKDDVDLGDSVEVEVVDLVEFLKGLNRNVDLLKIDVEGVEYDILLKLIESGWQERIGRIVVETHERRIPKIAIKGRKVRRLIRTRGITNIDLDWV